MKKLMILGLTILIVALGLFFIFKPKAPITIGFTAGLTGDFSSLGTEARNGYDLAVQTINNDGGIKGHPIESKILNNESTSIVLADNMQTFRDNQVDFVVGPLISSMAETIKDQVANTIVMSPSVTSDQLSGIDDYFFRIAPPTYLQPKAFIDYFEAKNINPTVSIVYDLRNAIYVNEFIDYLTLNYKGDIINQYSYGSDEYKDSESIISHLLENPTEVILCLTPAVETAQITQLIAIHELDILKFSVSWSMTADLVEYGGNSIMDMLFINQIYNGTGPEDNPEFISNYMNMFGNEPSFISALSYQATMYLAQAMDESDSLQLEDVKNKILELSPTILNEELSMNIYGDRNQTFTMYQYIDGNFQPIE